MYEPVALGPSDLWISCTWSYFTRIWVHLCEGDTGRLAAGLFPYLCFGTVLVMLAYWHISVNGKEILNQVWVSTFTNVQNQADSCGLTWSLHFRLCILVLFEISKVSFWDLLFSESMWLTTCLILQTRI